MNVVFWSLAAVTFARFIHHIHEIACRVAFALILKRDVKVRRDAEHVHQRPQREAAAGVGFEAEIDAHAFGARGVRLGMDRRDVGGAEIAAELVVEIHGGVFGWFWWIGKSAR